MVPQSPQWTGSLVRSTHVKSHSVRPGEHEGEGDGDDDGLGSIEGQGDGEQNELGVGDGSPPVVEPVEPPVVEPPVVEPPVVEPPVVEPLVVEPEDPPVVAWSELCVASIIGAPPHAATKKIDRIARFVFMPAAHSSRCAAANSARDAAAVQANAGDGNFPSRDASLR
jgi:hypothetical protein